MQTIILIILHLKMMIIDRECNIEIDNSGDHPEHEQMIHYYNLNYNLIERCMKQTQKQSGDYHFRNECKVNRTGVMSSVHNYLDYTDINNSDNDYNKDEDNLNKVLNELKDGLIEISKDYIKIEFKTEIKNE